MYWDKSLIKEAGRLTNYQSNLVWIYVNGFFLAMNFYFNIQDRLHIIYLLKNSCSPISIYKVLLLKKINIVFKLPWSSSLLNSWWFVNEFVVAQLLCGFHRAPTISCTAQITNFLDNRWRHNFVDASPLPWPLRECTCPGLAGWYRGWWPDVSFSLPPRSHRPIDRRRKRQWGLTCLGYYSVE